MRKILFVVLCLCATPVFAQSKIWIENFEFTGVVFANENTKQSCGHVESEGFVSTFRQGNLKLEVEFIPNVYDDAEAFTYYASNYVFGYIQLKELGKEKAAEGQIRFSYVLTDGVTKQYVHSTLIYKPSGFVPVLPIGVQDTPSPYVGRSGIALFNQGGTAVECKLEMSLLKTTRPSVIYGRINWPRRDATSRTESIR